VLAAGVRSGAGDGGSRHAFRDLATVAAGISVVLLGVGFWQQRRAKQCAVKRSYLSAVLLWSALALVVGMIFFPQEIAGFIADRFAGAGK